MESYLIATESCPKCGSSQNIRSKTLFIGSESPSKKFGAEERAGYSRLDQLAIDEVSQDLLNPEPLAQFVEGLYCDVCNIGFIPDFMLKK